MKLIKAFCLLSYSLAVLSAQSKPIVPEHRMEIRSLANPFAMQAAAPAAEEVPLAGPLPIFPSLVYNPNCRVLPFLSSAWVATGALPGGCTPIDTITPVSATTAYLAQWTFVMQRSGPTQPRAEPEITEGSWNQTVTNGFEFVTYCGPEYPATSVQWASLATKAINPSSNRVEPAFVVELTAWQNGVITMTGVQITWYNQNSRLDCNPTTCVAPCQ
jgi:hypothetical protein